MDWLYLTLEITSSDYDSFKVIDVSQNSLILQLNGTSNEVYKVEFFEKIIRKSTRVNRDDE